MPELVDRAREMIADLPPIYGGDTVMPAVQNALAQELDRIEYAITKIRDGLGWPHLADDEFRTLGMWEYTLELPVEPSDATLSQRQNAVAATLQGRSVALGEEWVAAVDTMLGSGAWSYYEGPGDYEVTISLPYSPGGYRAVQVRRMLRRITPWHMHITVQTGEAFLVGGPSQIGEDRL